jgi:hypothetical protein
MTYKSKSYRKAILWIAENDEAGVGEDALDPVIVGELVTSMLVGDVFGIEYNEVGSDVVKLRKAFAKYPPP